MCFKLIFDYIFIVKKNKIIFCQKKQNEKKWSKNDDQDFSELENEIGVHFAKSNFKKREGFKKSNELAAQYNIYRQNYCGCCYSSEYLNEMEEGNKVEIKGKPVLWANLPKTKFINLISL